MTSTDPFRIEIARDIVACSETVPIQREVWGGDVIVPPQLLLAAAHSGGFVAIGRVDGDDRAAGFVFGFLGLDGQQLRHHSHMLAISPAHRGSGLALALKQAQRAHCLAQGVGLMGWTMDPLVSLNAHFNFAKLRAQARGYRRDFYGAMPDKLNAGLPSDRLAIEWRLRDGRTGTGPPKEQVRLTLEQIDREAPRYLLRAKDGRPSGLADPDGQERLLLEIPTDFQEWRARDQALALEWRLAARAAFESTFAAGYAAVDFLRGAGRGAYLLTPRQAEPKTGTRTPA